MKIILCMSPEIWSMTDRIFSHLGQFFALLHPLPLKTQRIKILKKWKKKTCGYHFTQVYNKWQSYDIWFLDMKCTRQDFFFHLAPFFALLPPYLPEKWKCQKNEKMPGYIIILHKCTIKKWKLKKKFKKNLEISFYKSVPKIMVICHTVPEIWHMTDVIVTFHFGLFFTLLPP